MKTNTIKTTTLAAFVAALTMACGSEPKTPVDTTEPTPKKEPDPFQPDQCDGLICPAGQVCQSGLCVDNTQTPKFGSIEVATVTLLAKADVYLDGAMVAKMADLPYLIEMVRAGMEHTIRLGAPNWEGHNLTVMVMAEQKAVVQPQVGPNVDDLVGEWRQTELDGQIVYVGSLIWEKRVQPPDELCPNSWVRIIGVNPVGTQCVISRDEMNVCWRGNDSKCHPEMTCKVEADRIHVNCVMTRSDGIRTTMKWAKYPPD